MPIEVTYDPKYCTHCGNCIRTLPQVFRGGNEKFVVEPSAAQEAKARAAVAACPSRALKMRE